MTDFSTTQDFGRVDADGTVYVRTAAGDRAVGQWAAGDPAAGLAFYRKRFEGLQVEVKLLEQRIKAGSLSPDDASRAARKLRQSVTEANAVGDLDGLVARIDALGVVIEQRRQARQAERIAEAAEARKSKEQIVDEAERLAAGSDWRQGGHRLRELMSTWQGLPKTDKRTDNSLWERFSSARTAYTRRRKKHFAELNEKRDVATATKEELVAEAEAMSGSTDWSETARAYRDLMARWKVAGGAHRAVDDALWVRFRAAQDSFFQARDASNAVMDAQLAANAEVKREILAQAEKLLHVRDAKTVREAFRDLAQRWDAVGKVPRSDVKELEARFGKVEQTIRSAEDDRWRRSNPEAYARAATTVTQLEASIAASRARLEQARARGDEKAATQAQADVTARESWLAQARKTLDEFSS